MFPWTQAHIGRSSQVSLPFFINARKIKLNEILALGIYYLEVIHHTRFPLQALHLPFVYISSYTTEKPPNVIIPMFIL